MKHLLQKPTDFFFLLSVTFSFFILRLPSLHEPYWYGDEGIYQAIGYAMRHGVALYSGIWDNKPPLLYVIYALANGDQFYARTLSLIFGLAAVITFFFLAKKLLRTPRFIYISTGVFTFLFGIPMFEGNIANAENFMLFPILLAAYLIIPKASQTTDKEQKRTLLTAGVLLGIASLFKIVAIFDALAFFLFLSLLSAPKVSTLSTLKNILKKSHLQDVLSSAKPFIFGYAIPLVLTCLFFLLQGSFSEFLSAVFTSNIGYVGLENQFFVPQGLLTVKVVLLLLFLFFFLLKKDAMTVSTRFILLWLGFSLFNAYFSHRPYTHYILVLLPAFSLACGLVFAIPRKAKVRIAILLIGISALILSSFWYNRPPHTIAYYSNFISYVKGEKDTTLYRSFFDRRTPMIHNIASYLRLHVKENDTIFIWGDSAQLYSLTHTLPTGRYTVAYHMLLSNDALSESLSDLEKAKPTYIVVLENGSLLPFSTYPYLPKATIDGATIYERTL